MKGFRVFAIGIALAGSIGLGIYLTRDHQPPAPPAPKPEAEVKAPEETQTVTVYRVEVENNQAKLRPEEKQVPASEDPIEAALKKLVEQGDNGASTNPIPKGTKLLGVKVEKGLATVNLSKEFRDNFAGGSEQEGLTVGAVLRTCAQFPEIKEVQFQVEGKPLDSLGGHLDLSGPQDVHWTGPQFGGEN